MTSTFALEWMGGAAEHHFRKARSQVEDLPWGTIDRRKYSPLNLEAAKRSWMGAAIAEYRAVAAFTEVIRTLLEARAPLDLVGMASDFVADEVAHVEIVGRLLAEFGEAPATPLDYTTLFPSASKSLTPLQRANETMLTVACIGESFAGGTAAGHMRVTTHPLVKSIYELLVADESKHNRIGWLYFEWARESLDEAEGARLAQVATRVLNGYAPMWRREIPKSTGGVTANGLSTAHLHDLGSMETYQFNARAREVVRRDIIEPLAAIGIAIAPTDVASLLG